MPEAFDIQKLTPEQERCHLYLMDNDDAYKRLVEREIEGHGGISKKTGV